MFSCSHFSPRKTLKKRVEEADAGRKTWRRRTCGCEIETNDEFSVEDCQSVSNSTGFECIQQPGDTQSTVRIQTVPVRGDPWRKRQRKPWVQSYITATLRYLETNVGHVEQVDTNVRKTLGLPQGDDMPDIDINSMVWGIFMSATVKAAVHLGQDYQENLRTTKKTDFEKELILKQRDEIFAISTVEWNTIPWMRTTLLQDGTVKLSKAKVHVYSDSVDCLGKIRAYRQSIETWEQKIEWFMKSREYLELEGS